MCQHLQVPVPGWIKSEADFVSTEAIMRRSPEYRAARDFALHDPYYNRSIFEVKLPIEDVLGKDYASKVEGLRRLGSRKNPQGVVKVDFDNGFVVAAFRLSSDGEPTLYTLYPVGD